MVLNNIITYSGGRVENRRITSFFSSLSPLFFSLHSSPGVGSSLFTFINFITPGFYNTAVHPSLGPLDFVLGFDYFSFNFFLGLQLPHLGSHTSYTGFGTLGPKNWWAGRRQRNHLRVRGSYSRGRLKSLSLNAISFPSPSSCLFCKMTPISWLLSHFVSPEHPLISVNQVSHDD